MKYVALIALLFANWSGLSESAADLGIDVLHRPEDCNMRTRKGDSVAMHYTGTLADGTEFDSSVKRGTPIRFALGTGRVIKGWDQGLLDMCVGEKRKLTVPPSLGYGKRGAPPKIPGDSTLIFEVELMSIDERKEL